MRLVTIALLTSLGIFSVKADDLTTRDGTVYRNYHVVSSDPGYLTILYADGGGRIPLADLPPDLQRQYHYDPAQAAAYVKQFEAQEHQERAAVQSAQAPSSTVATTSPETAPTSTFPPPADTDSLTMDSAPRSDTASAPSPDFDPGDDPLQPGASILSQDGSVAGTGASQDGDYSYYAAYDDSGGLWVSSFDADGRAHWYRWDRRFDDRHDDLRRLDGNRDLPHGALVTLDRSGRWVVTYVDDHGHAQRFYRSAEELHADAKTGAWRVVVNSDGSRSLRPEHEEHQPPHTFSHYAYADHGTSHPGENSTFHGYGGDQHSGHVYGGVVAEGDNVHPGSIPPPTGNRPAGPQGSSSGSSSGTATPHPFAGSPTPAPPPTAAPPPRLGH